ncbi:hypothetical protein DFH05DRAFT_1464572 [Lentinula detonsa]|uniref:Uncharacterized protein n=1 Tax=Lentinula detonsa TaxID=2804962 RepID=A0A9W8TST0_9AGAR|nr:hypothetical protein DFH05DRAFT_1464572 [Lentinula detonsa]
MTGTKIQIFWAMTGSNGQLSRPSNATIVKTVRKALSNQGSWNCPRGIPPVWVIACGPRGSHPTIPSDSSTLILPSLALQFINDVRGTSFCIGSIPSHLPNITICPIAESYL